MAQAEINKNFQRKTENIFLPIIFNICFGCMFNNNVLLHTLNKSPDMVTIKADEVLLAFLI